MTALEYLGVFTGHMPGCSIASVLGVNADIDIVSTPEVVTVLGGSYTFLSSAQSLEVVSDSAADVAAGTGASAVRVDLLDANYVASSVNVSLNGTTPVAVTGGPYLRVNDMRITGAVGSNETNVGNVTLRVAGGGTTISYMLAGKGRAQQAIYTVPAGRTAFAFHTKTGIIRARQSADAEVELQSRSNGSGWIVRNTVQCSSTGNVSDISNPHFPPPFFEKTDLRSIVTAVSTNDTAVQVTLQLLLAENSIHLPAHGIFRELRIRP